LSSDVVRIAQKYLGARYVWGGSDPSGFDCSGLTWYVYDQVGVELPAGSWEQFSTDYGRYIDSISALAPGDLVFFERTTEETGITHVGIYAGDGKMIAARSERLGVRYVSVSDPFWNSRFVGGIRPYR
jgi:cell wall-associated NlpC family hydrolase